METQQKRGSATAISKRYVIQSLKDSGFEVENGPYSSLFVHLDGYGKVTVKAYSRIASRASGLCDLDKLYTADFYILVRADDVDNLRGYVYSSHEIDEISENRLLNKSSEDSFEKDTGEKAGYWVLKDWKFEKLERLEAWNLINKPLIEAVGSAINDVSQIEIDNDDPKYREIIARVVIRDDEVRRRVIKRANGLCEYGAVQAPDEQCRTFIKRKNNEPYLEAHHVLRLADGGKDEVTNVIALCANHHREAHSGIGWEALNEKFQTIIDER
jgi:hypothetical protein